MAGSGDRNRILIGEIEASQEPAEQRHGGALAGASGPNRFKMERRSVGFEQLSDIFGFRVIVKTLTECYRALGVVHTTWPVVPGRFKDYISTPKQNDYRSIHTTVISSKMPNCRSGGYNRSRNPASPRMPSIRWRPRPNQRESIAATAPHYPDIVQRHPQEFSSTPSSNFSDRCSALRPRAS
jgi:hypothetical protein